MRFDLFYGNGAVVVPEAALGYLDKADPLALKLFLQLCGDRALRESLSVEALAKSHAVTPSDIEKALANHNKMEDVLEVFADVQRITHCSTGCGGCHDKVLDVISQIMMG